MEAKLQKKIELSVFVMLQKNNRFAYKPSPKKEENWDNRTDSNDL